MRALTRNDLAPLLGDPCYAGGASLGRLQMKDITALAAGGQGGKSLCQFWILVECGDQLVREGELCLSLARRRAGLCMRH